MNWIYFRLFLWCSVGKVGQNSLTQCAADLNKAKDIFKKKWGDAIHFFPLNWDKLTVVPLHPPPPHRFFEKTKNEWEHKETFEKVEGKYDMVFVDYNTEEKVRNFGNEPLICSLTFITNFGLFFVNIWNYVRKRKTPRWKPKNRPLNWMWRYNRYWS